MDYEVIAARTAEEKAAAYRVRYKVFIEEMQFSNVEDFTDKQESDQYDRLDTTVSFLVKNGTAGLATARLIGPNNKSNDPDSSFGLPIEELYDLSCFKDSRLTINEISRSSAVNDKRATKTIMDLWKAAFKYAGIQNIQAFVSCTGTDTDHPYAAEVLYDLIKLKGFMHPEFFTPLKSDTPVSKTEKKRHLFPEDVLDEVRQASGLNSDNLAYFEEKGIKLPPALDYFTRLGGRFTGPPSVFPKFKMYTIPWILVLEKINEPFYTFFRRESRHIKI